MNVFLLTSAYKNLHNRQKNLENRINVKISNDIHVIQKLLDDLARQSKEVCIESYCIVSEVGEAERTKNTVKNRHREDTNMMTGTKN
jgi:hypothetical protein